jgi:uncharacterized protein YlxW (UPF0749 family)
MGLLHDLMNRPVEAGYAEAAGRGPRPVSGPARVRRTVLHLLIAVALGLVTASAVQSLRTPEPSALQSRVLLEAEIAERSAAADELQTANETVSAEIAQLQTAALAEADPQLLAEVEASELLSGAVAVAGRGLVLEVDDGPVTGGAQADPLSRVQDLDLQILTNGLWASGAEAIAINGQRLTALSAIRSAGPAILVDLAPLVAPYRIEAVGDVRDMQTAFARSSAARHLSMLTGTYGVVATMSAEDEIVLPGAGNTTLHHASAPAADVASSQPPDEEGSP